MIYESLRAHIFFVQNDRKTARPVGFHGQSFSLANSGEAVEGSREIPGFLALMQQIPAIDHALFYAKWWIR